MLAAGRSPDEPVATVMTRPIVSVSPEAFVLEALLEMTRRDIHHLLVVEGGRPVAVVSSRELLALPARAPLELSRAIQTRESLDELVRLMPSSPTPRGASWARG